MSKVDAMRALREARRAAGPQATSRAAATSAAPRKAASTGASPAKAASADVAEPATGLCGHRSMNGRSCTRDAGHAEKNHRYG